MGIVSLGRLQSDSLRCAFALFGALRRDSRPIRRFHARSLRCWGTVFTAFAGVARSRLARHFGRLVCSVIACFLARHRAPASASGGPRAAAMMAGNWYGSGKRFSPSITATICMRPGAQHGVASENGKNRTLRPR